MNDSALRFWPALQGLGASIFLLTTAAWCAESPDWRRAICDQQADNPWQAVEQTLRAMPEKRQLLECVADWLAQDLPGGEGSWQTAAAAAIEGWSQDVGSWRSRLEALTEKGVPAGDSRFAELYLDVCLARRNGRLARHGDMLRRIVFTKHYDVGGSHYAYTEGQSDAQRERHFKPGSALCVVRFDGLFGNVRTLIDDARGVIRDPDVSFDGRRILFAWKKSDREDDYHLYEIEVESGHVRQLTDGLGFADYEGCYLPNGHIVFNSTRCVQTVDCWWTEVSNLFSCDADGRYLRQVSFDQVHTNFPTLTDDGRVVYTRWDYSDRGQIYPQGLFQMYPDGTGQTEVYGNNSFFPTTILHARRIPGTGKFVCVFSGHHTRQRGWLGILDPRRGRQENEGAQLIAPVRDTSAQHIDRYGQSGDQFQYPYPLSESEFLVTFRQEKAQRFRIYWMDVEGHRELLVSDPQVSCNQPVPLGPRPRPTRQPHRADYRQDQGTVYLHDVYMGPGLRGVARGAIKNLRVVALDFRAAGVGNNRNRGPAGSALVSTPVSVQGTWDVKKVVGTVPVYDDGSACFTVPARTPLYFQALDRKGQMVQTMRSWVTLQPGEMVSCVGCHEHKNTAPPYGTYTQAVRRGPQAPEPFYGATRGFSFIEEIQPILDKHCICCHFDSARTPPYGGKVVSAGRRPSISATASHVHTSDTVNALSDALEPRHSHDRVIPRFTWWSHRGGKEWVEYRFAAPRSVAGVSVYWFDDQPHGGSCRTPESWRLCYRNGDQWKPVEKPSAYGTAGNRYNHVSFVPVISTGLRIEVQLKEDYSGGILEWKLEPEMAAAPDGTNAACERAPGVEPAFSLKGIQWLDDPSARKWSESYLALANRAVCNWTNVQSAPPMLPPHDAGASQSPLVHMLEDGSHYGVELSKPELDRIITWIDLLVPYAGDYTEAMDESRIPTYNHFLDKRRRWQAEEARNIEAFLEASE